MRNLGISVILGLALTLNGCSSGTQREAREALEQTGEAVESAADDAANVTEGVVEGASQAIDENQEEPDTGQPD